MKAKRKIARHFLLLLMLLSMIIPQEVMAATPGGFVKVGNGSSAKKSIPAPFNQKHSQIDAIVLTVSGKTYIAYCAGFNDSLHASNVLSKQSNGSATNSSGKISAKEQKYVGLAASYYSDLYNGSYSSVSAAVKKINANKDKYAGTQIAVWICAHGYYGKKSKWNTIINHLTSSTSVRKCAKTVLNSIAKRTKVVSYSKKTAASASTRGMSYDSKNKKYSVTLKDSNGACGDTSYDLQSYTGTKKKWTITGTKTGVKVTYTGEKNKTATIKCTRKIKSGTSNMYQGNNTQAVTITGGDATEVSYFKVKTTASVLEKKIQISLQKSSSDGGIAGRTFSIFDTEDGEVGTCKDTATTGTDGKLAFEYMDPGTYTIMECDGNMNLPVDADNYVLAKPITKNFTAGSDDITYYNESVVNTRCQFHVKIKKTIESSPISHHAKTEGAEYTLYSLPSTGTPEDGYELMDIKETDEEGNYTITDDFIKEHAKEEDVIYVDEKGNGTGKNINYDYTRTYFVMETKAPENLKISKQRYPLYFANNCNDTDSEDSGDDAYLLGADPIEISIEDTEELEGSPIAIQKLDDETKEPVREAGFKFQILDSEKNTLTLDYYEGAEAYDDEDAAVKSGSTFTTDEEGLIYIKNTLPNGHYYIKEVEAPSPYLLNDELKEFVIKNGVKSDIDYGTVTGYWTEADQEGLVEYISKKSNPDDYEYDDPFKEVSNKPLVFSFEDKRQKGSIEVYKYGNQFSSVDTKSGVHVPVFSYDYLSDVVFEVYKDNDEEEYKTPITTITTGKDGIAKAEDLELGDYVLIEKKSADGYLASTEEKDKNDQTKKSLTNKDGTEIKDDSDSNGVIHVSLTYDKEKKSVKAKASRLNETAKAHIKIAKQFSDNGLGGGKFEDVIFGLYANEEFKASNGDTIQKGDLIANLTFDADGNSEYVSQLPYGKYYVAEIKTSDGYILDQNQYEFELKYNGNRVEKIAINDGKAIINSPEEKTITTKKSKKKKDTYTIVKRKKKVKTKEYSKVVATGDDQPIGPIAVLFLLAFSVLTCIISIRLSLSKKR